MTRNEKTAVGVALLLWWLWPRLSGTSQTTVTWTDPDTGITYPVNPHPAPEPILPVSNNPVTIGDPSNSSNPDTFQSAQGATDLWDWLTGGGGGWYSHPPMHDDTA